MAVAQMAKTSLKTKPCQNHNTISILVLWSIEEAVLTSSSSILYSGTRWIGRINNDCTYKTKFHTQPKKPVECTERGKSSQRALGRETASLSVVFKRHRTTEKGKILSHARNEIKFLPAHVCSTLVDPGFPERYQMN